MRLTTDRVRDPLTMPVGSLAAWIEPLHPEDSIQTVARELAENGFPVIPIAEDHKFLGAISEQTLRQALANGVDPTRPASSIMEIRCPTILGTATGSEAMRLFDSEGATWLIVLDHREEPIGFLTPSRLFVHVGSREYHGRIGGMATPFGVYLTNGAVSSGANRWALVATGALMSLIFHVAGLIVVAVQNSLPLSVQNTWACIITAQVAWMTLFFLGLRILPLSGTHGAEHMVVHAIERGEELRPEVVSRMPRVHPRCGTNLAIGAMVFLTIMSVTAIKDNELRLLLAVLTTVILWQPLGSLFQQFVTTKRPNANQLADGIGAGQQFLERAGAAKVSRPTIVTRLLMSGLFQVMIGGAAVALLFALAYEVLKVPPQWRVS